MNVKEYEVIFVVVVDAEDKERAIAYAKSMVQQGMADESVEEME